MVLKEGMRGDSVRRLQEALAALGFDPGGVDGVFGDGTESAVSAFQEAKDLLADGVAGPITLGVLDAALAAAGRTDLAIGAPAPAETPVAAGGGPRLSWARCTVEPFPGGGDPIPMVLREDAAAAFKALHDEVAGLGGIVTSAGGRRGLGTGGGAAQSRCSMHYVGRAFDLALPSGMQNPAVDPFVVQRRADDPRRWGVWARVTDPSVPEVTVDACQCVGATLPDGSRGTRIVTKTVTARLVDFTALAAKHGFKGIRGRVSFFGGGAYAGAEWWHFQWEVGLVAGTTTFGQELARVYAEAECRTFIFWNDVRNFRFGEEWL